MEQRKETRMGQMQAKREGHMQRIAALQAQKDCERLEATRKREELVQLYSFSSVKERSDFHLFRY